MSTGPHCSVCGADVDPEGRRVSLLIVNESGSGQRVRHRFDHLCVLHTQEVRTFMERIGNVLRDGPLVGSPIADEKVEASW